MSVCSRHDRAHANKAANVRVGVQKIKTETETAPKKCAEIKGIKSHEAPAAVRVEGVVLGFPLPDTLNLSH